MGNFSLKGSDLNRCLAVVSFKQTHRAHSFQHNIVLTFTLCSSTSLLRFPHLAPIYINVPALAVRTPLQSGHVHPCQCLHLSVFHAEI